MASQGDMKTRIAQEFRRDDLTTDIANAIATAISAYKYERFPFNRATFVDAPAADGEIGNPWMNEAERLIRCRAKLEIAVNVIKMPQDSSFVAQMMQEIEEAKQQARLSQTVSNIVAAAGTLAYMKVRIANEINRGDLAPEIADAINDAIDQYQNVRFYFNETRENTITLVDGQTDYSEDDDDEIGRILKIDYVTCFAGGLTYRLIPRFPLFIEEAITNSGALGGIPSDFCFYNERIRLYPIPNGAYDLRVGYVRKMPAPETDGETGNVWMTKAEKLIRARAKAELYAHVSVIADADEAAKYMQMAESYLDSLESETTAKTQVGAGVVQPYSL